MVRLRDVLQEELSRLDAAKVSKRHEPVIASFDFPEGKAPRAVINGERFVLFNSNDYLGLRFHPKVREAEREASTEFGAGPGGVRFICGTTRVHKELEEALARFHGREECVVFSSAFSLNMGVLHALLKGQSRDSLLSGSCLVVSDAFNHRSIIDGIRVAGLPSEQKAVFKHLDLGDLHRILAEHRGKYRRAIIVTDGIFSMLGEAQDIGELQRVAAEFEDDYEEGVITIVDDSHGVAAYGKTGRGTEEATGGRATLLVGTLGKGFGVDGGYVVGDRWLLDYLRESAATYIYSNPVAPGTAAAACAAVGIVDSEEGRRLLEKLHSRVAAFKKEALKMGLRFAADSGHPIQPLLIGDAAKTRSLADELRSRGFLVTPISYPVVPKGSDEIRVQLSASHSAEDVAEFLDALTAGAKKLGII